ncbi:TonB-dependent receptor [Flavicella sp.]|nr:TonB-dependent receptor [Flavicella sp.]MDA9111248.1 TonB-dependent receptor [Flavicella sp.]
MKKFTTVFALFLAITLNAQDKATIQGLVTDKEMNNEPLPFANVFVKGTAIGVTTDFDGNYSFSVDEGVVVVVFSFVGYQTVEVPLTVVDGESYTLNQLLGASEGITMDEVVVQAIVSKEKETALLVEQKKAVVIKESIGAQRLAKVGVSNAAGATTKIAGVTKNESSSAVFIRGLGDRYLSTTMNGLPIPSDDVENKNINLNLFSTGIIQNVGISKTYTTSNYADQASGSVDIISKKYTKNNFSLGLKTGANTNVLKGSVKDNFRVTQNYEDLTVGFHSKQHTLKEAITEQSWNTKTANPLANFGISVSGGKKFFLGEKDLTVFATVSHSKAFNYRQGIFKSYRSNVLNNSYTDTELFRVDINTTGLLNLGLRLDENNKISYNSLFVNKTQENLFEQGRNGEGYVFDQDPAEYGAFVRDQNTKQTMMYVNQLLAEHRLSENNKLTWAAGMNYVLSEEPNRIRNEVNIEATDLPENVSPLIFTDDNTLQFAHVGDFQQRKSGQKVEDLEYNARIQDEMTFVNLDEDGAFKLRAGANIRHKERTFSSLFIGVRSKGVQAPDVDDLSSVFTQYNFNNRTTILRTPNPDIYLASLDVVAAYANYDFAFGKLSGNIGGRYEFNKIDLEWDVANFSGAPRTSKTYNSMLPSLNLKYELNEVQFVRIALSKTNTLPEFKELAPFEYVSPNGRVTKGNPNLEKSDNFNVDLKWEMFPENGGLLSATGFYKEIKNPINLALTRGSSGYFVFDNTGEEATVYGLEFEGRKDLIDTDNSKLNLNVNMTKMWFNQDLKKNFQYKGKTETNLQGASDFILNTALSFSTKSEREFVATTAVNYSSDKIAVLGAPEDQSSSETLYNDEIIEKGFVTLDLVVSKKLSEKLSLTIRGKNLLNPAIEQTQLVRSLVNGVETDETVVSYKKGSQVTLSLAYKF